MNREVLLARAETLGQWSDEMAHEGEAGASEVAFLFRRAIKLMTAIANGEAAVVETLAAAEAPADDDAVTDVKPG